MDFLRAKDRRKWERRRRRAFHVGNRIFGTPERPRLTVYRSHRHFHSQIIDDTQGRTLAAASTLMKDLRSQIRNGGDRKAAAMVGQKLAEIALSRGITRVVFDRNFYRFHGRVRAFAEAAARGGLQFLENPRKKDRAPRKTGGGKPAGGAKPKKSSQPAGAAKGAGPGPKSSPQAEVKDGGKPTA